MNDIIMFLGVSEFFKDISRENLSNILHILKEENISKGNAVFNEDDKGDFLYILQEGSIKITIKAQWREREEEMLEVVRPGEIFGEFSFIDGGRRSASAIALEDSKIFILSRADFDAFCIDYPEIGLAIMHNYAWIVTKKIRKTTMLWRSSM